MTKENNGWISVNSTKKDEIPLLTPLYIKTRNYGIYVGFLDIFPTNDNFDYIDEDGNEFIYKWEVPEISSTLPFNEVESYIPVPEVNDILQKTNWISVKDALPEPHKAVLVINSEDYFLAAIRSDGEFHLHNLARVYDVTHWQPLPPPPTK